MDPADIYGVCGEDKESCMAEFDTKWSVVFEFNAVVLFFLGLSYVAVALGAYIYIARLAGAAITCFWNCFNVMTLFVTAAYRYSKQGRLCAMS